MVNHYSLLVQTFMHRCIHGVFVKVLPTKCQPARVVAHELGGCGRNLFFRRLGFVALTLSMLSGRSSPCPFSETLPGPQRLSQPHFWLFRTENGIDKRSQPQVHIQLIA
jgi:hypothetical protein